MNSEKNANTESASSDICPVTGLPVLRKPEWTYSSAGKGFRTTFEVIGDNIIHTRNFGYATLPDVENAVRLAVMLENEGITSRRPYVYILDYSNLKGSALDGRKYFITRLKNSTREPKGMIFYGTSILLNLSINLARRLNIAPFEVHIVKDYSEAVKLALEILQASEIERDVSPADRVMSKPLTDNSTPPRKIITRDDWSMETGNFSLHFEVIDGDILHSISAGTLEEDIVESIGKLREKVITSGIMPDVSYYSVIGQEGVEKAGWKARRLYIKSGKEWYKKHPSRMAIFYGANRMLRAAFNLARPFLPFDARTVNNLESALELIAGEKTKRTPPEPLPAGKDTAAEPDASEQTQQYVDELLRFMGGIPWDSEGLNPDRGIGPSHPLSPVFDAMELIKTDMDELLKERTEAENELRESEDRYRAVFENTGTATVIMEDDMTISMANAEFEKLSGYSGEELEGKMRCADFVVEEDLKGMKEYHIKRRENGEVAPAEYEFRFIDRQGDIKEIFLLVAIIPGTKRSVCSLMDITALRKSLREKEILLKEIHHRVKNNMQIISSLLSLQSGDIDNERALSLIKNCEDRIRAMSLVHEKLYLSKDLSRIDFHDYLEDLSTRLFQVHRVDSNVVSFSSHIKDALFNIETAIPLGFIINELLSNAMKHAFPEGRKGNIAVELTQDTKTDEYALTVTDDGVGIPEKIDYRNAETFGLQLVDMLTDQLGGAMELDRSKGTSFRIIFKGQDYKKRI